MIVFRFDDLTTIGNNVVNMPCGSPCRFLISKGGDSSAEVVLTSGGTTLSATSADISPFSTDDYTGFDIITPADPVNIPYHAVISSATDIKDIDIVLNAKKSTAFGDLAYSVRITNIDSIGSHCYTFPTNSKVSFEVENTGDNEYLSFPNGTFSWMNNLAQSTKGNPLISGVFGCTKIDILTNNTPCIQNFNSIINAPIPSIGVYDNNESLNRFSGYDDIDIPSPVYVLDVFPFASATVSGFYNGESVTRSWNYVNVRFSDLEGNELARATYYMDSYKSTTSRPKVRTSYSIIPETIQGTWQDYYPTRIERNSTGNGTTPASYPTGWGWSSTDHPKLPDSRTAVSCVGEEKITYTFEPIKRIDLTITTKDTGFSYSK